jgi:hypothetical protein
VAAPRVGFCRLGRFPGRGIGIQPAPRRHGAEAATVLSRRSVGDTLW